MIGMTYKPVSVREHERVRYGRVELVRSHRRKARKRKAPTEPVR